LSFPVQRSLKNPDTQKSHARSFAPNFRILRDGCISTMREASYAGQTAFIWMSGPL